MIAACPQCQTRFRLAKEKIGPQGARIRCSSCQTIFRVQAPETPAGATTIAEPRPVPAAPPAPPKALPPLARALVIEPDPELAKGVVDLLAQWRVAAEIVDDGAEGLLAIFRSPPQLAVLGAGLPSLSAPKLAEIVRRTADLITVKLVRVAVADEAPSGDHDAEEMLEPADLPGGLAEILERFALGAKPAAASAPAPVAKPEPGPAPAAPKAAPAKPSAPAPSAAPSAAKPASAPSPRPVPSSDPEIAAAERLARIAVSDVILYNEAKFAAAAASGNVAKALASELEEARQHFNSRVSPVLRQKRDFLGEELERRAAQRKS